MSEVTNQHVPVDKCYPHPDNYNVHSESQITDLQTSLQTFGQVRSIVGQDDGNGSYLLVAGHGIHEAARREGLETLRADVIPPDWSATRVKAYLAADNELARGATPDEAQLAALVVDVGEVDETLARLAAGTDVQLKDLLGIVPNFQPVSIEEQPRLDQKSPVICPECNYEFVPA